jgi:hypothetical protein
LCGIRIANGTTDEEGMGGVTTGISFWLFDDDDVDNDDEGDGDDDVDDDEGKTAIGGGRFTLMEGCF